MKVALVVTNSKEKSLSFATDTLERFSLKKLLVLVEKGRIELLHRVQSKWGVYVRSNPNDTSDDNLDSRSISYHKLIKAKDDVEIILGEQGFRLYWKLYSSYLKRIQETEELITVDGHIWTPKRMVVEEVSKHVSLIRKAAKKFSVDPNTLGAIIIDEYARFNVLDFIDDPRALLGRDTSVGIAQIRIDTARDLIKREYYNPNPRDPKLSPKRIEKTSRAHLYTYVIQPKHNIHFAAARIRFLIDRWMPFVDISEKVNIIGTIYSFKDSKAPPRKNPRSNDRGRQIQREFYPLAKNILRSS